MNAHNRRKRILWVTFDFPPRQSSGGYRPVKIYKYLDQETFEVDFLTQTAASMRNVSYNNLLEELVPRPRIYRVPNVVLDYIVRGIGNLIRKKRRAENTPNAQVPAGVSTAPRPTVAKKLYHWFIMLVYFPDEFFLWGWLVALKALWLHAQRHYDLVYTTSPFQSTHLAGLLLKQLGVKWVADYRDYGVLGRNDLMGTTHEGYVKTKLRERLDFYYQRHVVRTADNVITHSETIKEVFCKKFSLDISRLHAIPNGYDEEDFVKTHAQGLPFHKKEHELHILHLGFWYINERGKLKIIEILNDLNLSMKEKGGELFLHAVGGDIFSESQKQHTIRFPYLYHGVIPHQDVIPYILAADCYLLCTLAMDRQDTTNQPEVTVVGWLPGKLWEYLRGGKPIMLFSHTEDEARQIAEEAGVGFHMGTLQGQDHLSAESVLRCVSEMQSCQPKIGQHSWQSRAQACQTVFLRVLGEHTSAMNARRGSA